MIKSISTKIVIQISSGHSHCLALTNGGELYAWGANEYGQLGLGTTGKKVPTATLVKSLAGIPIAFIVCGGNHSFAVSKSLRRNLFSIDFKRFHPPARSGAIFGWGKNTFGQLGLDDLDSRNPAKFGRAIHQLWR